MNVEDYGVPAYDELVIVAHRDAIHEAKIRKFLTALQAGVGYLRAHPLAHLLALQICRGFDLLIQGDNRIQRRINQSPYTHQR